MRAISGGVCSEFKVIITSNISMVVKQHLDVGRVTTNPTGALYLRIMKYSFCFNAKTYLHTTHSREWPGATYMIYAVKLSTRLPIAKIPIAGFFMSFVQLVTFYNEIQVLIMNDNGFVLNICCHLSSNKQKCFNNDVIFYYCSTLCSYKKSHRIHAWPLSLSCFDVSTAES